MKQLLIHFKYRVGQDEREYRGYVTAVDWDKRKQHVKVIYVDMNDDDFNDVTYLKLDDELVFEYMTTMNNDAA